MAEIDHKNGVRDDNRFDNLREADRRLNNENRRKAHSNNKLGLLGVSSDGKKFSAQLRVAGRQTYLGAFDTPEEAHAAYIEAKRKLHEGCTI